MSEHFKVGTKVALIHCSSWCDRRICQRTVSKVRKDGKFFVSFQRDGETVQSEQMWTPERWNAERAKKSGKGIIYNREHIEVWTFKHDEELAERAATIKAKNSLQEVIRAVEQIDVRSEEGRKLIAKLQEALSQ